MCKKDELRKGNVVIVDDLFEDIYGVVVKVEGDEILVSTPKGLYELDEEDITNTSESLDKVKWKVGILEKYDIGSLGVYKGLATIITGITDDDKYELTMYEEGSLKTDLYTKEDVMNNYEPTLKTPPKKDTLFPFDLYRNYK